MLVYIKKIQIIKMSWEYKKENTRYKFGDKNQEIIEDGYKNGYGYVDFVDSIDFTKDNITII